LEQNSAVQSQQVNLFSAASEAKVPEADTLVSALRDVQPDELSPKAALKKLYLLKKLV
jgi:DNA mismatch repair protein MutS